MNWRLFAACRDVDTRVFFPEHGTSAALARRFCARCAVRRACLEASFVQPERFGIWGGLTEEERRPIRGARWPTRRGPL